MVPIVLAQCTVPCKPCLKILLTDVHMFLYLYICACTCTFLQMQVWSYVHTYVYVRSYKCTCVLSMNICTYVLTNVCMFGRGKTWKKGNHVGGSVAIHIEAKRKWSKGCGGCERRGSSVKIWR